MPLRPAEFAVSRAIPKTKEYAFEGTTMCYWDTIRSKPPEATLKHKNTNLILGLVKDTATCLEHSGSFCRHTAHMTPVCTSHTDILLQDK